MSTSQSHASSIAQQLGDLNFRLSGKTILLAGGAGFLGRHFLSYFSYLNQFILHTPCRIISVDNYITGSLDDEFSAFRKEFVISLSDIAYPLPIKEEIHYIIHAAGVASPAYYLKFPLEAIDAAVQGTRQLLDLARRNPIEGVLFFSSSEIYGDPEPKALPTPETYFGNVSCIGPRACYDESKRLGETICSVYFERFHVPVKIVRPFNIFGPGMKPHDRRVIPMFTHQALNGLPLSIHGTGTQTRTFCYITDAINGFIRCLLLGRAGEAYNIGNDMNEISMNALGAIFSQVIPSTQIELIPYPSSYPGGEPLRRCPDLAKAQHELAYNYVVSVHDGVKVFVEWARERPEYFLQDK